MTQAERGRTETEIRAWMISHVSKMLRVRPESVTTDASFYRLGLDSVAVVSMTGALEEFLGRSVSPALLDDHPSIDALCRALSTGTEESEVKTDVGTLVSPATPPLRVYRELTTNRLLFNVMPGRMVEEILHLKEYRVWHRYAEATFDRKYRSEMLNSPDHLIFLTTLVHTQKLAYVCLCQEFGLEYQPDAPGRGGTCQ